MLGEERQFMWFGREGAQQALLGDERLLFYLSDEVGGADGAVE